MAQKASELRPLKTTLDSLSKIFVDEITARLIAEDL